MVAAGARLLGARVLGFYGTVFADAAFRFHAGKSGMAVLGTSLSIPFILGSLLQGLIAVVRMRGSGRERVPAG
jgi:hypothetical protein